MPYYLKVTNGIKMKKFVVHHHRNINLRQIKSNLGFSQTQSVIYEIYQPTSSKIEQENPSVKSQLLKKSNTIIIKNDNDFLEYLTTNQLHIPSGSSIKIRIDSKQPIFMQNKSQEEQKEIVLPENIVKVRSRSQQIPLLAKSIRDHCSIDVTEEFDLEATQEFLYQSMVENKTKIQQIESYLQEKKQQLEKVQQSNKTNIRDLLDFLKNYK